MSDLDPAAPGDTDVNKPGFADALSRANFGIADDSAEDDAPAPPDVPAAQPAILVDPAKARDFLNACLTSNPRVRYGLGDKVPFHGATPGVDFQAVDCSGFVREAIWHATDPHFNFKDGSVVQHDWVRDRGFTKVTVDAGKQRDGVVRIAFLRPQMAASGIGHVVLIHDGTTIESHGGQGPNSRPWTGQDWQANTSVYVLHS